MPRESGVGDTPGRFRLRLLPLVRFADQIEEPPYVCLAELMHLLRAEGTLGIGHRVAVDAASVFLARESFQPIIRPRIESDRPKLRDFAQGLLAPMDVERPLRNFSVLPDRLPAELPVDSEGEVVAGRALAAPIGTCVVELRPGMKRTPSRVARSEACD